MKKEYTNGNMMVTWEPEKCIHSEKCWRGLRSVFDPKSKPWVNIDGAEDDAIMAQIDKCPSGALGYYLNSVGKPKQKSIEMKANTVVAKKEPVNVELSAGKPYAWCACGRSEGQPFCDGAHNATDLKPMVFKSEAQGGAWLCQCKQTKTPPYCDGTHNSL
jgi:CDGSH-type Zn-finger protein/uncharacterized Fe-S cluster protein YjdI